MKQKIVKDIASTFTMVGLSLSLVNMNTSVRITVPDNSLAFYKDYDSFCGFHDDKASMYNNEFIVVNPRLLGNSNLEKETNFLFGQTRVATKEEEQSISEYIKSISKPTGINFFDIC